MFCGVLLVLLGLSPALAQENDWPRTVVLDEGTVTIYEPQVEELRDDFVSFRAALAYRESPDAEPVFGAGWFESDVQVDRLSRTVHPIELNVKQTRFPVSADVQTSLSEAMARPSFASNFTFSLDELEASMESTRAEALAAEKLNTAPPDIIYRDNPALLITIDGDPVLRDIENSTYQAVINTPYPLIHDGRWYYLNAAKDVWYRSEKATGPYRFVEEAPDEIALMVKLEDEDSAEAPPQTSLAAENIITAANAPEIVVSTRPAELIVTEGPAAFVPLVDDLLVLNNSEDDVFMHLAEQEYYIVLAGRWYRSKSLDGPWAFQESDRLPDAFARIPQESDQADSRVYVAGTEEAEEAVLDAQVPQTAAIQRGEADVDVQYDGEPVFAPVDGTDMVYASNTGATVILADGLYYLIEDGVWYVSTSYNGPWQVAVARPDQVRVILPTSPVYNVKYVYVYGYTPNVVYMGYTPGYMGSYVYHNTVFYGSGWYYRPWISPRYYYPYHRTWGFHVNYDPWYGWNFGLSWGWGPFSVSYWPGGYWHHNHYWYHPHYSYWGPHGYRGRHHRHHRSPGHYPPGNHPPGGGNRPQPYDRHHNLYRDERQPALVAGTQDKKPRGFTAGRAGDVPAGKAYAKNGGFMPKQKTAAYKAGPVSRETLAVKARSKNELLKSGQKKFAGKDGGKAYSKVLSSGKLGDKSIKAPARKLTRNDLALKARSSDQAYKTGQKKVVSSSTGRKKVAPFELGKASQPSAKNAYASAAPKAKQAPRSKAVVKRSPGTVVSKNKSRPAINKSTSRPVANRTTARPVVKASPGKIKMPAYSKQKRAPVVKLTGRQNAAPSYSKARSSSQPAVKASKPQMARQAKPQMSYKSAPQPRNNSAPKPAPQQSSRSKSKQKFVK